MQIGAFLTTLLYPLMILHNDQSHSIGRLLGGHYITGVEVAPSFMIFA